MKKLLIEIFAVFALSAAFGVVYNSLMIKPLPYFPKSEEELQIDEEELFLNSGNGGETTDPLERTVTYEQMVKIANNPDDFFIIDARRPELYAEGYIGDAVNIFPDDREAYISQLLDLPEDKTFICYCDGGTCDLSHQVAQQLIYLGYERVFLYLGGWEEWTRNNPS